MLSRVAIAVGRCFAAAAATAAVFQLLAVGYSDDRLPPPPLLVRCWDGLHRLLLMLLLLLLLACCLQPRTRFAQLKIEPARRTCCAKLPLARNRVFILVGLWVCLTTCGIGSWGVRPTHR